MEGSPETQAFTIDGKLRNERVGLGISFFNDVTNIIGRTSVALTAAYTIQLTEGHDLSFGMSGMMIQNRIHFERIKADDEDDPNLLSQSNNQTAFEGNVGISYRWKGLRVGFAADQIFQNEINHENAQQFESLDFNYVRHYITTAEYKFPLKNNFSVRPMVLVRTVEGLPSQFDVNTTFAYKDLVWTSLAYRHDIGVGVSAGFTIDERFVVGYTYEFPTSDLNILSTSSHEFVLGIRLRKRKAEARMTDELKSEVLDVLQERQQESDQKIEEFEQVIDRQQRQLDALKQQYRLIQSDLEELKKSSAFVEGETEVDENAKYYLIVGAMRTLAGAKEHQKILRRDGGLESRIIQNNKQTWYLIYIEELQGLTAAKEKIKAVAKGPASPYILGNPWIFIKTDE